VVVAAVAVVRPVHLRFGMTTEPGLVQSRQLYPRCPAASSAESQRIRDVSGRLCSACHLSLFVCPLEIQSSLLAKYNQERIFKTIHVRGTAFSWRYHHDFAIKLSTINNELSTHARNFVHKVGDPAL
jgi:hypothetical protein